MKEEPRDADLRPTLSQPPVPGLDKNDWKKSILFCVTNTVWDQKRVVFLFAPHPHWSRATVPSFITSSQNLYLHRKRNELYETKFPEARKKRLSPPPPSHDPEQRHHIIYHIIPLYLHKENFMRQKEIPALVIFFFFPPKIQSCGKPYYKSSNHPEPSYHTTCLLTYKSTDTHQPCFPSSLPHPHLQIYKIGKNLSSKKKRRNPADR